MKLYAKIFIFITLLFWATPLFAAGVHDSFEIILGKENAKAWEALDITISAIDKNWEIVEDYTGDVLVFSESDAEADFPNDLSENSYTFTAANEGTVKFENAVRFKNAGLQDVYVYDLNNDSILWVSEVTITAEEIETNADIEILSPENWVTLGKDTITISGTTKKNHQVRVMVNDNQDLFTTSNADGVFEKEVEWLLEGTNTISAIVLNADNEKIWESEKIEIKISASVPVFKSITLNPSEEVESEWQIEIQVVSNSGLSQVRAIMNDIITELTEGKSGVYTGTTTAPKEEWSYDIDVILRDEFALETIEKWVDSIMVIAPVELNSGEEETQVEETVETVIEEIELTAAEIPEEIDLTIMDIEVTELKTKSVITWKALADAESYNVYKKISDTQIELIENTTEARYEIEITGDEIKYEDFAIKAIWKTSSWEIIRGDLSEMTLVKTGPEMYIILALIALIASSGIFFMRRTA